MKPAEDCLCCSASEEMRWSYLERGNAQASLLLQISNSSKGFSNIKDTKDYKDFYNAENEESVPALFSSNPRKDCDRLFCFFPFKGFQSNQIVPVAGVFIVLSISTNNCERNEIIKNHKFQAFSEIYDAVNNKYLPS